MSPQVVIGIIALALSLAGALVMLGRVLQRQDDHGNRIKALEQDRKENGAEVSELKGEMKALRETIRGLEVTMGILTDALKSRVE